MGVGVSQLAELLLQWLLVRIRITVQAQQVDLHTIGSLPCDVRTQRRAVRVLICVEKDIGAVILVVTAES
jgi:hypothetical protein